MRRWRRCYPYRRRTIRRRKRKVPFNIPGLQIHNLGPFISISIPLKCQHAHMRQIADVFRTGSVNQFKLTVKDERSIVAIGKTALSQTPTVKLCRLSLFIFSNVSCVSCFLPRFVPTYLVLYSFDDVLWSVVWMNNWIYNFHTNKWSTSQHSCNVSWHGMKPFLEFKVYDFMTS